MRGLTTEFYVTAESILDMDSNYNDAVSKLVVRECDLDKLDTSTAIISRDGSENICHYCGKKGHVFEDCFKKRGMII